MEQYQNTQTIKRLLDEVVEFVENDRLFAPTGTVARQFVCLGSVIKYEVRNISEYIQSIRVEFEESDFLTLENDFISKVETYFEFFRCYQPEEFTHVTRDAHLRLSKGLSKSSRVVAFAQEAAESDDRDVDFYEYRRHIDTCLSRQLAAILSARALTLSATFAPTEVMFDALQSGLFPFGWSWETECVLCVRPSTAS
jgi:hypothetical protein